MRQFIAIFCPFFFFGCAGPGGLTTYPPPSVGAGAGAVAAGTAAKVARDIKEIQELEPFLQLKAIEVCYHTKESGLEWLECTITPCEKEPCTQLTRAEQINPMQTVYINEQGWLRLSAAIKAFCLSPHENFRKACRKEAENYLTIETIYLIGNEKK